MIQKFQVGEEAILQSIDAPIELWNAHVVITAARWMDHPRDIHGMPQPSTWVYDVDICDKMFVQSALRKINHNKVEIKEKIAVLL